MAITTGNHPKALWPGVKAFFGKTYGEYPPVYSQVFKTGTSDKAYEELVEETGFSFAPVKAEAGAIAYVTDRQGYINRLVNVTYGLGAIVTREAIEDNQYESVAPKKAAKLARSMRATKEVVHARLFNQGFSGGPTFGDGKTLLASDHPTLSGNQSNILSVAADLSEAALEDAMTLIRTMNDSAGLRIQAMGKALVIPPQLSFDATRILSSTNQSATANNDTNAIRTQGLLPGGVVTWSYLTDADAWFITTDIPDGLMSLQRRALELTQDNDFDTENARMKATERYVAGFGDWRCVVGSPGV